MAICKETDTIDLIYGVCIVRKCVARVLPTGIVVAA